MVAVNLLLILGATVFSVIVIGVVLLIIGVFEAMPSEFNRNVHQGRYRKKEKS